MKFITPPNDTKALEAEIETHINSRIEETHRDGKNSFRTYGPHTVFGRGGLYGAIEKDYPDVIKKTLENLRKAGYKADIRAEEKSFVDIYLSVSW